MVWERDHSDASSTLGGLPLRRVEEGGLLRLADARRALGWWLVGTARAMLTLARQHALDRVQFGRPIASFQAVRHRLAETLVAIEGAEATLSLPGADNPDLTALLAKAAAGKAALTAARHCQQVLGGIGFTAEHDLHHHVKRALVLDGLLGSSRELTRKAGAGLRARGSVPRLVRPLSPRAGRIFARHAEEIGTFRVCSRGRGDPLLDVGLHLVEVHQHRPAADASALPWPVWWMSKTDWIAT